MIEKTGYSIGGRLFPDGKSYSPEKLELLKKEYPEHYKLIQESNKTNLEKTLEDLAKGIDLLRRVGPNNTYLNWQV